MLFQCDGYRGFAASREAGEPEGTALLTAESAPLWVGDGGVVPSYVAE